MLSADFPRLRYPHTSIWRLTLLFTMLTLLVNALALATVYGFTVSEREQQVQRNVLIAADTYRRLAIDDAGATSLRRIVDTHARGAASTLLALETGAGVSGNLSAIPGELPQYPQTDRFAVAVSQLGGDAAVELARGTWIAVGPGRLMVAQLEPDSSAYQRDFLLASALALGLCLLLTLVVGYFFNRRQLGRLRGLSESIEQIQRGRLETRLPTQREGDELDVLAGQVNCMLDEIDDLLLSVAGVTDNIAHDLRTPLSRLSLRLEDMDRRLKAENCDTAIRETLTQARSDLDHLVQTFEAMLDLSRLEKGALQVEGEPCVLADIASDVVELLAPMAEERGQRLTLISRGEGSVIGNASLLFRALYNLVDNAIRYAGAGATIVLREEPGRLSVEDSGPGIPVAERERVFERLYRLDQSRSQPGTGLGLAVVRAIARLHGASIRLLDATPGLIVVIDFLPRESV
ncbi:HAMP domain-containing protein [Seongchinamella sediminis]|uniref:histidine kinase n=1 Tax=Seongchinamella sediminis TaxID=2283635 RepID=A0A3L7E0G4_9GAMM|nr:ATP-binding protein [Seongchinamella sediminis]RLQ21731.1 HAMP domain-containing protein [Seongchinamella sediminis]